MCDSRVEVHPSHFYLGKILAYRTRAYPFIHIQDHPQTTIRDVRVTVPKGSGTYLSI